MSHTFLPPCLLVCSEISLPLLVQVSSTKSLGILIDKNMTFQNHKGMIIALEEDHSTLKGPVSGIYSIFIYLERSQWGAFAKGAANCPITNSSVQEPHSALFKPSLRAQTHTHGLGQP